MLIFYQISKRVSPNRSSEMQELTKTLLKG